MFRRHYCLKSRNSMELSNNGKNSPLCYLNNLLIIKSSLIMLITLEAAIQLYLLYKKVLHLSGYENNKTLNKLLNNIQRHLMQTKHLEAKRLEWLYLQSLIKIVSSVSSIVLKIIQFKETSQVVAIASIRTPLNVWWKILAIIKQK